MDDDGFIELAGFGPWEASHTGVDDGQAKVAAELGDGTAGVVVDKDAAGAEHGPDVGQREEEFGVAEVEEDVGCDGEFGVRFAGFVLGEDIQAARSAAMQGEECGAA
jgi:hypothetical protein